MKKISIILFSISFNVLWSFKMYSTYLYVFVRHCDINKEIEFNVKSCFINMYLMDVTKQDWGHKFQAHLS